MAPLLVALVTVPLLIEGLGTPRFAVLTLVWMGIGYFSLFDLGLGRALVQVVSERLGRGAVDDLGSVVWTALLLMGGLGGVGAVCLLAAAPWLVDHVLNVPAELRLESVYAFRWVALAVPFAVSTAGLRGILEAHQRFDLTSGARLGMGVFTYVGPVLILPFTTSLVPAVVLLVLGRIAEWLAHAVLCFRTTPALWEGIVVRRAAVRPLLRFGAWLTVSNILSPIMVYLDRFLVGGLLSVAAVAYYVTPYEVVIRLLLVPSALLGVLFPAFASSFAHDRARAARLFDRAIRLLGSILFPVVLVLVVLGREGLDLWVGPTFAQESTRVLQWLAVGVLINALAWVPVAVIQGAGRSDIPGKVHLAEAPLYVLTLWWLVSTRGIEGAALAWMIRATIDAVVMFVLALRLFPGHVPLRPYLGFILTSVLLGAVSPVLPPDLASRVALLGTGLALYGVAAWFHILIPEDRAVLRMRLVGLRDRVASAL
ncbi:MAG: flippase [Gemmatimonadetes bacterium]|nr:flippase [Gemmatimonadota bacterium]